MRGIAALENFKERIAIQQMNKLKNYLVEQVIIGIMKTLIKMPGCLLRKEIIWLAL